MARMVQRRAAVQNAFLCSVEQNFWADPPVIRVVNSRPHQRQWATWRDRHAEPGIAARWSATCCPML